MRLEGNLRRWCGSVGVLALIAGAAGASDGPGAADALHGARMCEYGITQALNGNAATAETAFVALMSDNPVDSRALNNLGNLHLIRGEPDLAIAFYDWAVRYDSTDAGIRLNRAAAYLASNDPERAQREAGEGVRLAGGAQAAARLLGLRGDPETEPVEKGAERIALSPDELRLLLRAAAAAVPADSARRVPLPPIAPKTRARDRTWRTGGPRAAEAFSVNTMLYWKR